MRKTPTSGLSRGSLRFLDCSPDGDECQLRDLSSSTASSDAKFCKATSVDRMVKAYGLDMHFFPELIGQTIGPQGLDLRRQWGATLLFIDRPRSLEGNGNSDSRPVRSDTSDSVTSIMLRGSSRSSKRSTQSFRKAGAIMVPDADDEIE